MGLKAKEKVYLLEDTILKNDISEVDALFDRYTFDFTASALGLAMRYCGEEMVRLLLDRGAALDYILTPSITADYNARFVDIWRDVYLPPSQYGVLDYAQFLFPGAVSLKQDSVHRPISQEERMKVIRLLDERRVPTLHSFLYFAILAGDEQVYDYLRSRGINRLASPYIQIVEGRITTKDLDYSNNFPSVTYLARRFRELTNTQVADILRRFLECVPGKISVARLELLNIERVCSPEIFPIVADNADITRKFKQWDLIFELLHENNVAGIDYILKNKWIKGEADIADLLKQAQNMKQCSPEILSLILTASEDTKRKNRAQSSSPLDLNAKQKPPTLKQIGRDWRCRKIGDGSYELSAYHGNDTEIVIPSAVSRGFVTRVGQYTFSLTVPNIDKRTEQVLAHITSIEFPGTVKEIYPHMFGYNGAPILHTVIINEGTERIHFGAFEDKSKLKNVHLPSTLQFIGRVAFKNCKALAHLDLPSALREIGDNAFGRCTSLEHLDLPPELSHIGKGAFSESGLKDITLPPMVQLGEAAFRCCENLRTVTLSDGLESIPKLAFYETDLEEVTVPKTVHTIGSQAFGDCARLNSVAFEPQTDGFVDIGEEAFIRDVSLEQVAFPSNLRSIDTRAFSECGLTSLVLPEQLQSIGSDAFSDCRALTSVHVPKDAKVGPQAFRGCVGLANQSGNIIVNGVLYGHVYGNGGTKPTTKEYLRPFELTKDIHKLDVSMDHMPQIVWRRELGQPPENESKLSIGGVMFLGRFPQNNTFKLDALEWTIVALQKHKALLLSSQAIMCRMYDPAQDTNWESSAARDLLNGPFLNIAFTDEERRLVLPTPISTRTDDQYSKGVTAASADYVFLLDRAEVGKYLRRKDMAAKPTPYAWNQRDPNKNHGEILGHVNWLLRDHGNSDLHVENGNVTPNGGSRNLYLRPAMWINI